MESILVKEAHNNRMNSSASVLARDQYEVALSYLYVA